MTPQPTQAPLLQLYPDPSGYIDATWWPRSSDLAAELPELITALQLRAGPVWRVVYDPNLWSPAERHLMLDDREIRLDPYPFEVFGTVYVCGMGGAVIVVQAIPCENDPPDLDPAHRPITNHASMGA